MASRRDGVIKYCLDEAAWDVVGAVEVWKRELINDSRKKRRVKALDIADQLGLNIRTLRSWTERGHVWGMRKIDWHKGRLKKLLWVDPKQVRAYAALTQGEKRALTIAENRKEDDV